MAAVAPPAQPPPMLYGAQITLPTLNPASLSTPAKTLKAPLLVVGGGPVGLFLCLTLARLHKQPTLLIERAPDSTPYPKMEYTNGRSMEIYRTLGLSESLRKRAATLVSGTARSDEVVATSIAPGGKLLHLWEREGADGMRAAEHAKTDGSGYLEPHMRCHQIVLEKWLRERVMEEELITPMWGWAATGKVEEPAEGTEGVTKVEAVKVGESGELERVVVESKFVVACDGGGSLTRKGAGIESPRSSLGMTMAFVHFRSASVRKQLAVPRSWHMHVVGGGIVVDQNDNDVWTMHYVVPPGMDASTLSVDDILSRVVGGLQGPVPVEYDEIYCRGVWKTEIAIANAFRSTSGNVFLAGDSAHQLSPMGGHGLNSGIGDAYDLAWKLSAMVNGWGGEGLLKSYSLERRDVALQNVKHVQDAFEQVFKPMLQSEKKNAALLNLDGPEADAARAEISEICRVGFWIHNQNNNILGVRYPLASPILDVRAEDEADLPAPGDDVYPPSTYPGGRAPHVWMKDGKSTMDVLDHSAFSLVDFSADGTASATLGAAARELGVPVTIFKWGGEENVKKAWQERELVLVRPDSYVSWRSVKGKTGGLSVKAAREVLQIVSGRA